MSNTLQRIDEFRYDDGRAEAFAGRMIGILNDSATAVLISVGHQAGLFDAMAELPPSTAARIAEAAERNERYVREWLGGMVAARVVEYERDSGCYYLPPEHAASLTRAAGTDNIATFLQYIGLAGEVESGIVDCFRNGGGLPYSAYPRFGQLQADESRQTIDATLLQRTLPLEPALVERLEAGIDVAEIGCGFGHAANVMAQAFPASRFTGFDISVEAIRAARAEAKELGLTNVTFEVRDVAELTEERAYDLITAFDAIHDQARPRTVLAAIERALRDDGLFLMVDIAASSDVADNVEHPLGPTIYFFSVMHCMSVSLAVGGEGLGTAWGEQKAVELLEEAGFTSVDIRRVEGDILNGYFFVRK
jgi:SAM-dependent methyltransferase